ncbi:hypothetical protein ACFPTY_19770 [Halomonas beimenensis]
MGTVSSTVTRELRNEKFMKIISLAPKYFKGPEAGYEKDQTR